MQVNLNQAEIVSGIKTYVANQGISLAGKKVEITFTAGRKGAGISAVVVVEDVLVTADNPLPAEKVVVNGEEAETKTVGKEKQKETATLAAETLKKSESPSDLPKAADADGTTDSEKEGEDRPLGQLPKDETKKLFS